MFIGRERELASLKEFYEKDGITSGVAKYLSMIDSRKSIDDNIIRLFFRMDVNAFCCFATLTDTH